jgi:hypothetical protein
MKKNHEGAAARPAGASFIEVERRVEEANAGANERKNPHPLTPSPKEGEGG